MGIIQEVPSNSGTKPCKALDNRFQIFTRAYLMNYLYAFSYEENVGQVLTTDFYFPPWIHPWLSQLPLMPALFTLPFQSQIQFLKCKTLELFILLGLGFPKASLTVLEKPPYTSLKTHLTHTASENKLAKYTETNSTYSTQVSQQVFPSVS